MVFISPLQSPFYLQEYCIFPKIKALWPGLRDTSRLHKGLPLNPWIPNFFLPSSPLPCHKLSLKSPSYEKQFVMYHWMGCLLFEEKQLWCSFGLTKLNGSFGLWLIYGILEIVIMLLKMQLEKYKYYRDLLHILVRWLVTSKTTFLPLPHFANPLNLKKRGGETI